MFLLCINKSRATLGIKHAGGLSVDWINDNLYYVYSYIGVLDLTTNIHKRLITERIGTLYDIIVDPTKRLRFIGLRIHGCLQMLCI